MSWIKTTDSSGKLTLECIENNFFSFNEEDINKLAKNSTAVVGEDISHQITRLERYAFKEKEFATKVKEVIDKDGKASRRVIISWVSSPEISDFCISLFQLLPRENHRVLNVYIRSSDSRILPSDLGFLSRLAIAHSVNLLQVFIGSLHIYL